MIWINYTPEYFQNETLPLDNLDEYELYELRRFLYTSAEILYDRLERCVKKNGTIQLGQCHPRVLAAWMNTQPLKSRNKNVRKNGQWESFRFVNTMPEMLVPEKILRERDVKIRLQYTAITFFVDRRGRVRARWKQRNTALLGGRWLEVS